MSCWRWCWCGSHDGGRRAGAHLAGARWRDADGVTVADVWATSERSVFVMRAGAWKTAAREPMAARGAA
ncbi:MAG: hypothetical protein OXU61_10590 [Gammaproteobacteria bacterium]|nr:hypothetical protein [Gammaproteobacteria bacterium]